MTTSPGIGARGRYEIRNAGETRDANAATVPAELLERAGVRVRDDEWPFLSEAYAKVAPQIRRLRALLAVDDHPATTVPRKGRNE